MVGGPSALIEEATSHLAFAVAATTLLVLLFPNVSAALSAQQPVLFTGGNSAHSSKMFTLSELATVAKVVMKSSPHDSTGITSSKGGSVTSYDGSYMSGGAHGSSSSSSSLSNSQPCFTNCSGHGLCHEGECWCEVQFRGSVCQSTNLLYYTVFSCLFFLLSIVSLVQLAVCIQAEYHKQHKPSLRDALTVTNQKLVYIFVTIATASRGLYFAIQLTHPVISFNLQTVYYPLILTIFSLIVCQWAESFHINDLAPNNPALSPVSHSQGNQSSGGGVNSSSAMASRHSRQQNGGVVRSNDVRGAGYSSRSSSFLTKSLGAFITFNVIMYILLFLQLLATNTWVKDIAGKKYWMRISKACFASLTLLVVVFFLIYGVEMFFKVRGAFVDNAQLRRLNKPVACSSRLSLIFQAGFLLFLAMFLFSDVAFIHFEQKITDLGISYFDTACRAVDLCVAIWFPIVLWKSAQPDELWLLNPRFLLLNPHSHKHTSPEVVTICSQVSSGGGGGVGVSKGSNPVLYTRNLSTESSCDVTEHEWSDQSSSVTMLRSQECFICYDTDRDDAGPLINPCKCKGDTSVVHHDCLRRWILESLGGFSNQDNTQDSFSSSSNSADANSGGPSTALNSSPSDTRRTTAEAFRGLFGGTHSFSSSSGYASCSQNADSSPFSSHLPRLSSDDEAAEIHTGPRGSVDGLEGTGNNELGSHSSDGIDLQSSFNRRLDLQNFRLNSGALGLLLGGSDNANLRCKVCNQPYQLQTSFMIQCQAHNWKLWLKWVLGLAAMTAMPFAVSAVFQFTTEPAPRVLALALLFLFEYALWRLAGFNLVTLYNYAKFSSFRIEGKEVKVTRSSAVHVTPSVVAPQNSQQSSAPQMSAATPDPETSLVFPSLGMNVAADEKEDCLPSSGPLYTVTTTSVSQVEEPCLVTSAVQVIQPGVACAKELQGKNNGEEEEERGQDQIWAPQQPPASQIVNSCESNTRAAATCIYLKRDISLEDDDSFSGGSQGPTIL